MLCWLPVAGYAGVYDVHFFRNLNRFHNIQRAARCIFCVGQHCFAAFHTIFSFFCVKMTNIKNSITCFRKFLLSVVC